MRFSPTETASLRAVARAVCVAEPELPPRVPFSPAETPVVVARGILEDELAQAGTVVATR